MLQRLLPQVEREEAARVQAAQASFERVDRVTDRVTIVIVLVSAALIIQGYSTVQMYQAQARLLNDIKYLASDELEGRGERSADHHGRCGLRGAEHVRRGHSDACARSHRQ